LVGTVSALLKAKPALQLSQLFSIKLERNIHEKADVEA
jgi:hypothetical protein